MRLNAAARVALGVAVLGAPVTAEAAPPGVAKTTHIHLKKAVRPPEPTYRGPTRPRSPVMVFVGIPPAVIGTLAAVAGFGYALRGDTCSSRLDECASFEPKLGVLIGAAGLVVAGGGVTLIVVGAQRVPAPPRATLTPWATPQAGGLMFELRL